ncbi:mobilization protein [Rhizobium calliandrae]|uniref:Mobilization protein n=1 Tax=Rhizobium calliandrae TaxID=1312182 RepID=A0ABT7KAE4_9HYPH|nr:mobilization protein [Rhizobium calliandrae]MDL2405583.1 mobilization protein [Rhizobium calliandrae]
MARKTIEQRIAELEVRKKTLKARLERQERVEDTRRKILLGALVLHRLELGKDQFSHDLMSWLRRELPGFLSRDHDKALFPAILDTSISQAQDEPGMDSQP